MIGRKLLHKVASEIIFPVHENPVPRHKHVIKNNQALLSPVKNIAYVHSRAVYLSCVTGLSAVDIYDPFGVTGQGKRNSIILVFFTHSPGWHTDDLMRIYSACLVHLVSTNHNAI